MNYRRNIMKKKSIVAAISALSLIVSMNTGIGSVFAGEQIGRAHV